MKSNALNLLVIGSTIALAVPAARAQFSGLGDAYNYAVLQNNNNQNSSVNGSVMGNVGIGSGGSLNLNGSIFGSVAFAASAYSGQQNRTPSGGVQTGVAEVNTILNDISSLSQAFGSCSGANSLAINASGTTQTIYASNGTLENAGAFGSADVFNVSSVTLQNGGTLQINGTSSQRVVLNVEGLNAEFNGNITLSGGLTAEDVIINIVGGEFQNASGNVQNVTYVGENVGGGFNIAGTVDGPVYISGSGQFNITGNVNCPAPVPEPAPWIAGAFLLVPVGGSLLRMIRDRSRKPDATAA